MYARYAVVLVVRNSRVSSAGAGGEKVHADSTN
jgi:hypothetical protein